MSDSNWIVEVVTTVKPNIVSIKRDVSDFKRRMPSASRSELANAYGNQICWKFASVGVVGALPGVVPGLGLAAGITVGTATLGAEFTLMLRWMGAMAFGIGYIYNRDVESNFNREFVGVLGLWCNVLVPAGTTIRKVGRKIALAQIKRMSAKPLQKINQRVGVTILTKFGTRRGGVALGKLIPLGVGAVIGGGFNLATMQAFKTAAINHFKVSNPEYYISDEDQS